MYYIGIDIGKQHHEASIVDSSGNLISKSLKFSSTRKGADKLMNYIIKNISDNNYVVGMEATGHYWYTIYSYLVSKGITVLLLILFNLTVLEIFTYVKQRMIPKIHFSSPK